MISISSSGSSLLIDNYGIKNSYPKESISLELSNSMLEIKSDLSVVLTVRGIENISSPSSTSLTDLLTKIVDFVTVTGENGSSVSLTSIITSKNLYNPAAVSAAYIVNATGATVITGGQAAGSKLSEFIKVDPDTDYYISGRNVASGSDAVAYYDASKVLIATPPFGDSWQDGPVNGVYRTGPTTEYIRVQTRFNGVGTDENVQIEKGSAATSYVPFETKKYISTVDDETVILNISPYLEPVYDAINAQNHLKNLILNIIGDSITEGTNGVGATNTFWYKACSRAGMVSRNYGIAGTRLSTDSPTYGLGMSNPDRYSLMDNNADYIGFFGGTNDVAASIPIGLSTDSTRDTFMGALNVLCIGLIEKYPTKKVFAITLFNHKTSNAAQAYADATIAICSKYGIPVLDWFRCSNVYPLNSIKRAAQMANDTDYQHPNAATHLQLSYQFENFLRSI